MTGAARTSGAGFILIDGRMVHAEQARVSVFDRGFQYGDALIETLRCDCGTLIAPAAHLQRLHDSAAALGIRVPERNLEADVRQLLARNELTTTEAWARITVTRGVGPRGLLPAAILAGTVIVAVGGLDPAIVGMRRHGIAVVTLPFGRGAALARHKHPFYLPSIEGKRLAAAAGGDDGLFTGTRGVVEGGTTANLFAFVDDVLLTPRGGGVLPGITRARTRIAARELGWRIVERRLQRRELAAASEAFLTNALFEIVPIVRIDGAAVGGGRPGTRTRTLQRSLLEH